jgi:hypothetical protein
MIVEEELTGRTISPKFGWQSPTTVVLQQTCMGVFFTRSVSDTTIALLFFRNRLRTSV